MHKYKETLMLPMFPTFTDVLNRAKYKSAQVTVFVTFFPSSFSLLAPVVG